MRPTGPTRCPTRTRHRGVRRDGAGTPSERGHPTGTAVDARKPTPAVALPLRARSRLAIQVGKHAVPRVATLKEHSQDRQLPGGCGADSPELSRPGAGELAATDRAPQPHPAHQPHHRASGDRDTVAFQQVPYLADPGDPEPLDRSQNTSVIGALRPSSHTARAEGARAWPRSRSVGDPTADDARGPSSGVRAVTSDRTWHRVNYPPGSNRTAEGSVRSTA